MRQVTPERNLKSRPEFPFVLPATGSDLPRVARLTEADRSEVLAFLRIRPVHTVVMASYISDNGIEGSQNRGTFFGYRDESGRLEGVALIGHATLIEARSDRAMAAFARKAKDDRTPINLIMSEHGGALEFWAHYAPGASPRLNFTELLFETAFPMMVRDCAHNVRPAVITELHQIAEAHAEVAFVESGRDPMVRDREGFLQRVARRIEMGRTFVVFDEDRLIFKADVVAEAGGIVYLEGVWVTPELRGKGIGSRCLSKLNLILLEHADVVCLLSNERFTDAHRSFAKAGYRTTGRCTTLFV